MSNQTDADRAPPSDETPDHAVIRAALALAARQGWRTVTLGAIAAEAGLSLAALYRIFHSKVDILVGLIEDVDTTVLAIPAEDGETPRDRLFDILMRRFDALGPYRDGLRRVIGEMPCNPLVAVALGPYLARSMGWMLEAAGIDGHGVGALVERHALVVLYLSVVRVWLEDETADLALTMAALDSRLRRVEWLSSRLRHGIRRKRSAAQSAKPDAV